MAQDANLSHHPRPLDPSDLSALLQPASTPCITIHLATSRVEADQNRIRFKDAVKQVESSLNGSTDLGDDGKKSLLAPLHKLEEEELFWRHQTEGLSVFRSPGEMRVRTLLQAPQPFVGVADSYHVKPLIRIAQDASRYQVLCVSMERVALYEGDRQGLHEVPLASGVPSHMAEALGGADHVEKTKRSRYEPEDSDSRDRQVKRYFRRLDEALLEHHPAPRNVPLILAALAEYHGHYHEASHNNRLSDHGIKRDPFHDMDLRKLGELAWEAVQPAHTATRERLMDRYGNAAAHNAGSDNLTDIAKAAIFGNVEVLMIQNNHRIGGTIDSGTGEVTFKEIADPRVDDVIDDLAETALQRGGEVLVLDAEEMPSDTGVAAILRRPAVAG